MHIRRLHDHSSGADPGGVQGVRISALLIRVPFLKVTESINITGNAEKSSPFWYKKYKKTTPHSAPSTLDFPCSFQMDWTPLQNPRSALSIFGYQFSMLECMLFFYSGPVVRPVRSRSKRDDKTIMCVKLVKINLNDYIQETIGPALGDMAYRCETQELFKRQQLETVFRVRRDELTRDWTSLMLYKHELNERSVYMHVHCDALAGVRIQLSAVL